MRFYLVVVCAVILLGSRLEAQSDFYQGKQLKIVKSSCKTCRAADR